MHELEYFISSEQFRGIFYWSQKNETENIVLIRDFRWKKYIDCLVTLELPRICLHCESIKINPHMTYDVSSRTLDLFHPFTFSLNLWVVMMSSKQWRWPLLISADRCFLLFSYRLRDSRKLENERTTNDRINFSWFREWISLMCYFLIHSHFRLQTKQKWTKRHITAPNFIITTTNKPSERTILNWFIWTFYGQKRQEETSESARLLCRQQKFSFKNKHEENGKQKQSK